MPKSRRLIRFVKVLWIAVSVATAVASVISAWGGKVDPDVTTIPALMAMAFPMFLAANIIAGVVNLFVARKWAIAQGAALLLSLGAIWNYCPLNFARPNGDEAESGNVLTFMTFNTFQFEDAENIYPNYTNRTASEIINCGADIVCVQEVGKIIDIPFRYLTKRQIDSLNRVYPYSAQEEAKMVAVLSKIPMKEITLEQPQSDYAGWTAGEIVFAGDTTLIVSVHLQSIGLNDHDKEIYHEMTNGDTNAPWRSASKVFYHKLSAAFRERASQARMLRHQLDSLGYRNVILAGDFNDIAQCYAARTIEGSDMRSVFSEVGLGPMITYHKNRFYFNIDHIFYKGAMRPLWLRRGTLKSSDHYPLHTAFKF